jgi:hypothetical protein
LRLNRFTRGLSFSQFVIFPNQTGTATSSPVIKSLPPLINISKVEEWMKSNAYEPTTIKQTIKRLRHLMSNCDTNYPEEVKKFVSNKSCSNAYKECLIETYDIYMQSKNKRKIANCKRTIELSASLSLLMD